MSMGYSGRNWQCPFFRWDEREGLHCEGGCVRFRSKETYSGYTKQFCCRTDGWEKCTLAKALIGQYEEEERRKEKHGS